MPNAPTLHSLKRARFLALLVTQVTLLLVSPFLDQSRLHQAAHVVLLATVLIGANLAVGKQQRGWIIAFGLGLPWLVLSLISFVWQKTEPSTLANLFFIAFIAYTLGVVLKAVVTAERVDFDILLGAVSVYFLIALIWAFSYKVIHTIDPSSFSSIHDFTDPHFHEFMYFSLTTLTTLGYGDITPVAPFARIWSTLEAVVGTLYIAVLVARLVGMYGSHRPER